MCRVEERIYIGSDGRRQTFEEAFPCDKAQRGKLCSKVKRRTTEYFPKAPPINRDDASSPASNNPPTPTGTGSYLVQQRRPSGAGRRDSIRGESARAIKPEIIIEFGSKKDKGKKYPHVSLTTKAYKRTSTGSASAASGELPIDSPGSDASYPIRTGFPEASVPPVNSFSQSPAFTTRPAVPQARHRHTSSASSNTTSSQPPSLYATSEPDSPSRRVPGRHLPPVVHNPPTPSSPTASRVPAPTSSGQYRTKIAVPQGSPHTNIGPDGLTPLDYSDFIDHSASSQDGSHQDVAPEITRRGADRELRRKQEADKRRQEDADRRLAEEFAKREALKQEEIKQVRFVETEKKWPDDREEAARRKKGSEEKTAKKPVREKTKPPTREFPKSLGGHRRRQSMTQADMEERDRLLRETEAQMARERIATEQRERAEQAADLMRQQQTSDYYNPRVVTVPNTAPGLGRRGSVSSGRRPSVSIPAPPMGLGRSNSTRRVSIIQPTPPPLTTQFPQQQTPQQQYSTRPSSAQQNAAPLFSPSYTSTSRPPSARHSSYIHDNPFAQPPTRTSHSSQDSNPFAQPSTRTIHPPYDNPFAQPPSAVRSPDNARDPWERDLRENLPHPASHRDQFNSLQRRGEEVINRSDEDRSRGQRRAQQATQNMGKVFGYENDYESSSENEEDKLAGYGSKLGRIGKRRT